MKKMIEASVMKKDEFFKKYFDSTDELENWMSAQEGKMVVSAKFVELERVYKVITAGFTKEGAGGDRMIGDICYDSKEEAMSLFQKEVQSNIDTWHSWIKPIQDGYVEVKLERFIYKQGKVVSIDCVAKRTLTKADLNQERETMLDDLACCEG